MVDSLFAKYMSEGKTRKKKLYHWELPDNSYSWNNIYTQQHLQKIAKIFFSKVFPFKDFIQKVSVADVKAHTDEWLPALCSQNLWITIR